MTGIPRSVYPFRTETNLQLGDLTLTVAGHEGLAEQLDAVYLSLDTASAVIPAPSSADGSAQVLRVLQSFVSCHRARARRFSGLGALSWRDDCGCVSRSNCLTAFAGVVGTAGCHGTDLFACRELVEQVSWVFDPSV